MIFITATVWQGDQKAHSSVLQQDHTQPQEMCVAEQGMQLHISQVRERMESGANDHVHPLPQIYT